MILAQNKKAKFDYHIIDSYEAGLSMSGKLVKLIRAKKVSLAGTYIVSQNQRLEIIGVMHGDYQETVPVLVTTKEKSKILTAISEKGVSCIPIDLHTKGRWLKATIATVKGKTQGDKRQTIKKRDLDREVRKGLV